MIDQRRLASQAAANHGLLQLEWLRAAGVTDREVDRRLASGAWAVVHPEVYRVAAVPATWHQRLHAAVLAAGPGAAVSHRAAVALWELDGGEPDTVEVAVPRPRWPRLEGVVQVHRSTDLHEAHVVLRHGIRVTNPMRSLVDLGAVVGPARVGRAFDHAVGKRLVTYSAVERMNEDLARKGRRGVGVMRKVLAERAGAPAVAGVLEARMAALLRRHGVPAAVPEVAVHHGERWLARVDFAYPDLKLALEVDGEERHGGALQHDLARQNALVDAGWEVLRFTWHDVTQRPEHVAGAVARAIRRRHSLLVTAGHHGGGQR